MNPTLRIFISFFVLFLLVNPVQAAVEIAWSGQKPHKIDEVYIHDGVAYLAVEDVLTALGLRGDWSAVDHLYRVRTSEGRASMFPGGKFLKINGRFIPLDHPPRFIDGRFRVAEDFVLVQLPLLTGKTVYFRNLNPLVTASADDTPLDKLFAFLLQKKRVPGSALRAVAIDVGHGGEDTGSIGLHSVKEKDVVLQIARRLEKKIKMELGIPVYLSRDGDYRLSDEQRLETAGKPDVDLFVLLHAEAAFSEQRQGIHLFVRPEERLVVGQGAASDDSDSLRLALATQQTLTRQQFNVSQVHQAPLLPLGRGNLPTILVELGYLSNPQDYQSLTTAVGQKRLAEGLFAGLQQFAEERRSLAK